ncbi:hypothetical protein GY45DRAFT_739208 [Cubamyces sp. BRFM 1775]|nr:hypothetical protein GY45DRAFT_739208 [Cubamyces sp. BRFM 1775]
MNKRRLTRQRPRRSTSASLQRLSSSVRRSKPGSPQRSLGLLLSSRARRPSTTRRLTLSKPTASCSAPAHHRRASG